MVHDIVSYYLHWTDKEQQNSSAKKDVTLGSLFHVNY